MRLKQTMGNTIKGKIEPEQMISKYECSLLNRKSLVGLLALKVEEKNGVIVYSGDIKRSLASQIQMNLESDDLYEYACQTVQTINDVRKLGLDPKRLVLNPDWIFLSKGEKKIKFIYCPVNGLAYRYDGVLFLKDLVLQASLNSNVHEAWEKWLGMISKTGITDKSLSELEKYLKVKNKSINGKPDEQKTTLDEDGEAPTGMDDATKYKFDEDGEVPTGSNYAPEWMQRNSADRELDDDGEALTGSDYVPDWMLKEDEEEPGCSILDLPEWMDDTNIFAESGLGDGTYIESVSESLSKISESNTKTPTLLRKKTGETARVEKDQFKLGRSEQRADFCIRNNRGISNIHAAIIRENNRYYLKDNHSTNGTYVEGEKILDSTTLVPLHNGTVIQLYDEDFIFNL